MIKIATDGLRFAFMSCIACLCTFTFIACSRELPTSTATAPRIAKRKTASTTPLRTTLSFVAHPDDDLLFMNPDIASDVQAGYNVWVVYLTAGDDITQLSPAITYANYRIDGLRAAYALAADVADNWTYVPMTFSGHELATNVLNGTNVHLVYTFIHEGGDQTDGCGDLFRMLHNPSFVAQPIDGRASYTLASLQSMLTSIIQYVQPNYVRVQDTAGYANPVMDHRGGLG